ncbi:MAG: hypothetical protein QM256_03575 [Pseudomonadota bacterium]|jgi:hypothetical protein|nr:hypothetical protein [Pseudomonadota bacterium]NLX31887.1 hypothetical protein [Deltaproteobacteria bacterium]HNU86205.1 hypothetical protein [Syntrophales bacterium]HNZ35634.1 hypothetical protein [Syntrophales bacterium]HOF74422.1 hypothetical protein [Syntrophales bacterium]
MNLKQWADNGWLKSHKTSREEIANLLAIVERDLADAANESISPDSRFGIAYNAALKLCTVLLSAAGYRADKTRHHYLTIQAMPLILGRDRANDAQYLDTCRNKRNIAEYHYVGNVTARDVEELTGFAKELSVTVRDWLKGMRPDLL